MIYYLKTTFYYYSKFFVYNSSKHEKSSLNNFIRNITKVKSIEKEIAGNDEKKIMLYIYPRGGGGTYFLRNICCPLLLFYYLCIYFILFLFFFSFFFLFVCVIFLRGSFVILFWCYLIKNEVLQKKLCVRTAYIISTRKCYC